MIDGYMHRRRWEAQVQSITLLETWAKVMPKTGRQGGKVSVDEFLKITG